MQSMTILIVSVILIIPLLGAAMVLLCYLHEYITSVRSVEIAPDQQSVTCGTTTFRITDIAYIQNFGNYRALGGDSNYRRLYCIRLESGTQFYFIPAHSSAFAACEQIEKLHSVLVAEKHRSLLETRGETKFGPMRLYPDRIQWMGRPGSLVPQKYKNSGTSIMITGEGERIVLSLKYLKNPAAIVILLRDYYQVTQT